MPWIRWLSSVVGRGKKLGKGNLTAELWTTRLYPVSCLKSQKVWRDVGITEEGTKRYRIDRVTIEGQVFQFLAISESADVSELYDALRLKNPLLTKEEVADLVWRLAYDKRVDLESPVSSCVSFGIYLRMWERNVWLYASLVTCLVTILVAYFSPAGYPYVVPRWALGTVFVLFIPGYLMTESLFPNPADLNRIERVALSVGFSMAFVPFVAFLLGYTAWGIKFVPLIASLTIFVICLSLIALLRHYTNEKRQTS